MLPNAGVSAATAGLPVDIRRFSWINRLAADYAFDYARLERFFAGNPADPAAWRDAITRTQRHERPREAVAAMIAAQQRRRGAPAAAQAAAESLRDARTVAVVTGQQAGLFGGPLYTLLKAVTAVRVADQVRQEHHVPAVAVFWVDAEDHDWDEVKSCTVLDPDSAPRPVALPDPAAAGRSIAHVQLDASVDTALAELQSLLSPTEFTPQLLDDLRRAYRSGAGMSEAFSQWLESVLGPMGLVVYDASDPAAKPLVAGLFAKEVEAGGIAAPLAAESGAALQQAGYHAQVTPQDGSLALFCVRDGRQPIRRAPTGGFLVGDRAESAAALQDRVRQAPGEFSPNVLLRPLVQDTLFPTVCFVGGPSELAYHAQLGTTYEAFGLPRPLVQPRASATLLDSNAARFLSRTDLPIESLRARDESVLNQLLEAALPPAVDASLQDAARSLEERMSAVAAEVSVVDQTLEGAARSTLSRMQDDLKKLQAKVVQAAKRKDETLRRQFKHAQAQAFPAGEPQERVIGFVYFLNKYGPSLVDRLRQDLPADAGTHWILTP